MSTEASHWTEDPDYPVIDWVDEAAANCTRQSYAEWVQSQKERDAEEEAEEYSDDDYREVAGYSDQVEVDAGATVSRGDDDGAYVQAWVWVSNDSMRRCGYEQQSGAKSKDAEGKGKDGEDHAQAERAADPKEHRALVADA